MHVTNFYLEWNHDKLVIKSHIKLELVLIDLIK